MTLGWEVIQKPACEWNKAESRKKNICSRIVSEWPLSGTGLLRIMKAFKHLSLTCSKPLYSCHNQFPKIVLFALHFSDEFPQEEKYVYSQFLRFQSLSVGTVEAGAVEVIWAWLGSTRGPDGLSQWQG